MYWYRFSDAENQIAREQAKAQADESDQVEVYKKTVGNLGEIAFNCFCEDYLPEDLCEWENDESMSRGIPEYSDFDFEVAKTKVDIKATSHLKNLNPKVWLMKHGLAGESGVYVFVFLTEDREEAAILGWAHYRDLTDTARTHTDRTEFRHFHLRDMHELIALLNIAPE